MNNITELEQLVIIAEQLMSANEAIEQEPLSKVDSLSSLTPEFSNTILSVVDTLTKVHQSLKNGEFELLRTQLESHDHKVTEDLEKVPRLMRGARLSCGLYATNAVADLHLAIRLLDDINNTLGVRLVGVVAEAGDGWDEIPHMTVVEISEVYQKSTKT